MRPGDGPHTVSRLRTIVVPAAVFQSVIVGGAYGTGREVVEYVSAYGALGGLLAIGAIAVCFALILSASFEFARVFDAWDYRHFLQTLLGPAWLAYELMFALLLILILAITGAAAGRALANTFDVPASLGIALLFASVVALNYFGRAIVQRTLTAGAAVLLVGLIAYTATVVFSDDAIILDRIDIRAIEPGWWLSGIKFAVYNSALIPVLIYCARGLPDRRSAISAGLLAGTFGVIPAVFFHLTFIAGGPEVLEQALPTYWMLEHFATPAALSLYVIILFATIVQTGVGVLQGLNERLDGWYQDKYAIPLSPMTHGIIAGVVLCASLVLARFGLVALVAKGYGTLAWGFFIIFTLPVLTIGLGKIRTASTTRNGAIPE